MAKAERLVGVVVGVPRAFVAAGRAGAVGVREEGRALGVTVRGLGAREVEEAEARVDGAVLVGVLVVEVVTGLAVREVNSALVLFAGVDTGTALGSGAGAEGAVGAADACGLVTVVEVTVVVVPVGVCG